MKNLIVWGSMLLWWMAYGQSDSLMLSNGYVKQLQEETACVLKYGERIGEWVYMFQKWDQIIQTEFLKNWDNKELVVVKTEWEEKTLLFTYNDWADILPDLKERGFYRQSIT